MGALNQYYQISLLQERTHSTHISASFLNSTTSQAIYRISLKHICDFLTKKDYNWSKLIVKKNNNLVPILSIYEEKGTCKAMLITIVDEIY